MRRRLLDFVVCPQDGAPLELVAWESRRASLPTEAAERARRMGTDPEALAEEIGAGVLVNRGRRILYPIYNGIPRLLTFPTGVSRTFAREFRQQLENEFPGFRLPDGTSATGERHVLRSFSSEWLNYDWSPDAYWDMSADDMYRCMRYMLDVDTYPVRDKVVLEVGIGIGGIARSLVDRDGCELVGVDLSYAVDAAQRHFGGSPFFHVVQASVFALPFRSRSFDLAFSHGVLHHTFSTAAAFERLASMPGERGRLYVWVYSPGEEERTLTRRALMLLERLWRPVCWRLPEPFRTLALIPLIPLYLVYQNVVVPRRNPSAVRYGLREAMHAARDRFTPRFAHRHTEDEVTGWFRAAGYERLRCASKRQGRPPFVPESFVGRTAVDGVRRASAGGGKNQ